MNTEQPYFVIKVTRCGECRHLLNNRFIGGYCGGPTTDNRFDTYDDNRNGITPTCPMWPQVQQEKKDE